MPSTISQGSSHHSMPSIPFRKVHHAMEYKRHFKRAKQIEERIKAIFCDSEVIFPVGIPPTIAGNASSCSALKGMQPTLSTMLLLPRWVHDYVHCVSDFA